jgi:acetyl esterase
MSMKHLLWLAFPALIIMSSPTHAEEAQAPAPYSETIQALVTPIYGTHGKSPAILLVHGGGWTQGSPTLLYQTAEYLTEQGYLCALASYRLADGKSTSLLEGLKDVRTAYRELVANSKELGIDPQRIYILGESAGGHLAAAAAMLPALDSGAPLNANHPPLPAGLILINPVLDLPATPWLKKHDALPAPEKLSMEKSDQVREALSPQQASAKGLPPVLIIHGQDDTVVSVEQAEAFTTKLEGENVDVTLVILPFTGHAFLIPGYGEDEVREEAHIAIMDWLNRL